MIFTMQTDWLTASHFQRISIANIMEMSGVRKRNIASIHAVDHMFVLVVFITRASQHIAYVYTLKTYIF